MSSAMLYHAGQIIRAFTMFLMAGTLTAQNNNDHICKHIMEGDFDMINIGSITSDLYSSSEFNIRIDLIIYLRYNHMYRINMDDVGEKSINMEGIEPTGVDVGSDADMSGFSKEYFHKGAHESKVDLTQLKSFYHFRLSDWFVIKNGLFYSDNKAHTMFTYKQRWGSDGIAWVKPSHGHYPSELTLVHNQKESSSPTSYAIHRDIYDGSGDFIIYQMWILVNNFELDSLQEVNADQESKSSAWYWFFEKTNDSSVVKLANRMLISHMRDPAFQLFTKLPVGFLHKNNRQLYLFDQSLGCVYNLVDWNDEALDRNRMKKGQDLYFKRINIPYEKYFQCNPERFPKSSDFDQRHTSDRCETSVEGYYPKNSEPTNPDPVPVPNSNVKDDLPIVWIIAGVGGLLLVLLIGGVVLMKTGIEKTSKGTTSKLCSTLSSSAAKSASSSKTSKKSKKPSTDKMKSSSSSTFKSRNKQVLQKLKSKTCKKVSAKKRGQGSKR